jgi:hypothetical protein
MKAHAGDCVEVLSKEEILGTLELVPICGRLFRVSTGVERFLDQKTEQLRRIKTPAVILEGVNCKAPYSGQRVFCPRNIHLWWREIWLERVSIDKCHQAPIQLGASATPDKANTSMDAEEQTIETVASECVGGIGKFCR